jgi:hypothetical protein
LLYWPSLATLAGDASLGSSPQPASFRRTLLGIEGTDDWGAYTVDEAALRHGTGVEEETNDGSVAYGRFPEPVSTRYRDGWLPG